MPNPFAIAEDFYEHFPSPIPLSDRRKRLLAKFENILENAMFLSSEKKKNIRGLFPYFSDEVLESIKNTIIRENLRWLINQKKK